MTRLWVLAPAIVVVGGVPVLLAAIRLTAELRALRADIEAWTSARSRLGEINQGTNRLRARFHGLRDR